MTIPATGVTTQVYRVYIKAPPQAVWDAIIQPEWTERYGYCVRSAYDLRPGGTYRGLANDGMLAMGAPEVVVDGEVIEADPPRRLVQTWRMLMDPTIAAEGFTRLSYEIHETAPGVSRLTVTHELEGAPMLSVMVSGVMEDEAAGQGQGGGGGWNWILSDLKTLLETGTPMQTFGPAA